MTDDRVQPHIDLYFNLRRAPFGAAHPAMYEATLAMCEWADGLEGVGASVSLGEHHASSDGYLPSPIVLASAIAGRTQALRTTITLLLPLYHPVRLAEDLAVLDLVSAGRTDFLFAAGYLQEEFAQFGVDLHARGRLMEEGIEAIKAAWTGETFEFHGAAARVTPRPLRQPRPPIAMAGSSPVAARRAARMADSFAPTTNPTLIDAYRIERERLGKDPGPLPAAATKMQVIVGVSDDPDTLWDAVGPHCLHEINMYAQWLRRGFGDGLAAAFGENPPYFESRDVDELRRTGRYLVQTPEECIDWARAHTGRLRIDPLVGGNEPERAWQTLHTIEADVLPELLGAS